MARAEPSPTLPAKARFGNNPGTALSLFLLFWGGAWLTGGEMNVGQSIWDKLFRLVLVLLVVAGVLGIVLWYQPVIEENQRMREEKLALDGKIEQEAETARKLDLELRALQNPATVERLARERLSYAKPGENVIHFDPPAAPRTE